MRVETNEALEKQYLLRSIEGRGGVWGNRERLRHDATAALFDRREHRPTALLEVGLWAVGAPRSVSSLGQSYIDEHRRIYQG